MTNIFALEIFKTFFLLVWRLTIASLEDNYISWQKFIQNNMNVTIRVWHFFIYFCSYFANIKHDLHFLNLKRKNFTVLDPNIFRTKKAYLYYDAIDIIYN